MEILNPVWGIEGLIGCGKSTILNKLITLYMNIVAVHEPFTVEQNAYFPEFYRAISPDGPDHESHYPYLIQMYFLLTRHTSLINAARRTNDSSKILCTDRSIPGDWVFASSLHDQQFISKPRFDSYLDLYETIVDMTLPKLLIFLRVDPEIALSRIKARGREFERGIDLGYLKSLAEMYERLLERMQNRCQVLIINNNEDHNNGVPEEFVRSIYKQAARLIA